MQFSQHQQGQQNLFSQWRSLWNAPAMLALCEPEAMLPAQSGRSTASPSQSGSTAPALQKVVVYRQQAARLLMLVCFLASMTGCAVVKATNQPDKKNLSVFSAGTPRKVNRLLPQLRPQTANRVQVAVFRHFRGHSDTARLKHTQIIKQGLDALFSDVLSLRHAV
jgi:hypothetical protein